jgi:hypothetical protein
VAKGAIGNLTIHGMGDRAGKHSVNFAHAGSRAFPRRKPELLEAEGHFLGSKRRAETGGIFALVFAFVFAFVFDSATFGLV